MTSSIFSGLKILDLSTVLAGPSVATFFAELGAEVIKIENPVNGGDVTRSWKLSSENPDAKVSAYFSSVNFGKKYLWKNLSDHSDRKVVDELIKQSDVIIVNFKKGDDEKFRLRFEDVIELNSSIIYAGITGFASQEDRVAYDVVLQAETGYMSMNGTTDSGPVKMPVAMIDVIAAHQLKEGILCALIARMKDNKARKVNCSLEKAGLSALVNQATNYLMAGNIPQRMGSLHPNIAPYGEIFYGEDGKPLVLAVGSEKQFKHLVTLLGNTELAEQSEFRNNQLRVVNRLLLQEKLIPLFKQKKRDEWIQLFIQHSIPAGAVLDLAEVMERSVSKSMIIEEEIDGVRTKRMKSVAFAITENH